MKKFILIVLLLAVLGGAGYYAYTQFYSNTSADMESVLPSGAIFYTRFSDVENNRQKIISTDVWKNWKKIDFKSLFSELNNTVVQQEDVQKFFDNITGPDAQNIYKKFLSTDVALAFYPTDFDYGSVRDMNEAKMLEKVFGGLFLVTRVSADVQAAEFLSRFVNNFGKNVTVRKVEYEGHTIQLIPLDSGDAEIGFVRFNDLMVLGIGESPAKRAIDVYKKTAPSLAEDAVIMKARKNALSSPDVFSFWDMAGYFRSMMTALNGLPNMQDNSEMFRQEMEDLERSFSGIEGFSLSVDIDTSLSTIKSDFYFNIDQMKNTALA
ncbi:MAG: hypothetical protein KC618_04415, partial [Candidatus Omnitrophica bacterium]|nr:hypothetical protein [Candidatus Omnitrophota bacterium]